MDNATVTVSPKYQIVIPQPIRQQLGLKPGQKLQAIVYNNQLRFIPLRPLRELRGSLRGIGSDIEREEDRI